MTHRPDQLPEELAPPQAPLEFRQRVLASAHGAMDGAAAPDMWAQIWGSRPARQVWAASIGALIFGHLVIGGAVSAGPAESAFPLAAATGTNDELAEIVGLQRVIVDLPGWEVAPRDAVTPENQPIGNEGLS